jgi:hypothetical protein
MNLLPIRLPGFMTIKPGGGKPSLPGAGPKPELPAVGSMKPKPGKGDKDDIFDDIATPVDTEEAKRMNDIYKKSTEKYDDRFNETENATDEQWGPGLGEWGGLKQPVSKGRMMGQKFSERVCAFKPQ